MDADQRWRLRPQSFTRETGGKEDRGIQKMRIRYEAELEELLADGWEPFAVSSADGRLYFTVWLRKLGEK